jgi:hypothetical protein
LPETRPSPSRSRLRRAQSCALTPELRPRSKSLPLRFSSGFLPPLALPPRLAPLSENSIAHRFRSAHDDLPPEPPRNSASARAHASHGVHNPLRDKSYGSPLGYPDRSLDQDPRLTRPESSCVPPSGFLSLSTACSSRGRAALFHAAATCRVSPSRGFPFQTASPDSSSGRALLPLQPHLPEALDRNLWLPSMRPTGFKALLRLKVRSQGADVTLSLGPIPSWDSGSSTGLVLSLPWSRLATPPPLMPLAAGLAHLGVGSPPEGGLPRPGLAVPLAGLQRVTGQGA